MLKSFITLLLVDMTLKLAATGSKIVEMMNFCNIKNYRVLVTNVRDQLWKLDCCFPFMLQINLIFSQKYQDKQTIDYLHVLGFD